MHWAALWTAAVASIASIDLALGGLAASDIGLIALGAVPVALFAVIAAKRSR